MLSRSVCVFEAGLHCFEAPKTDVLNLRDSKTLQKEMNLRDRRSVRADRGTSKFMHTFKIQKKEEIKERPPEICSSPLTPEKFTTEKVEELKRPLTGIKQKREIISDNKDKVSNKEIKDKNKLQADKRNVKQKRENIQVNQQVSTVLVEDNSTHHRRT